LKTNITRACLFIDLKTLAIHTNSPRFIGAYIKIAGVQSSVKAGTKPSSGGIAAIFFFYLWTVFYTPSWNGTPWVLNSEMFDQNVRLVFLLHYSHDLSLTTSLSGLGQASAAANNWLWNFLISRFTPQMFLKMGYGVYFFFASLMVLSVPFVYFLIPETKSVPLEAMDRLFEIKPVTKAHKVIMDELREQEEEFRHDAEGAGLSTVTTNKGNGKGEHFEKV
jgi:hypothetical protein